MVPKEVSAKFPYPRISLTSFFLLLLVFFRNALSLGKDEALGDVSDEIIAYTPATRHISSERNILFMELVYFCKYTEKL